MINLSDFQWREGAIVSSILHSNIESSFPGYWSQNGCILNQAESTAKRTVCECSHLTHFAVLLSPGVEFGPKSEFALTLISYIGVPISIVAMAITVLINGCFR